MSVVSVSIVQDLLNPLSHLCKLLTAALCQTLGLSLCLLLILLQLLVICSFLPSPHWAERVEEADILEEVGVEPETRRNSKHGDEEQNQSENGHGEEETQQAQTCHREVPDANAHLVGPDWEEDNGENKRQSSTSIKLRLPLWALVQPDVVEFVASLLLLLNLDVPETLDSLLLLLFSGCFDFGDAKGEKGEREQFECVLGAGAIGDGR